MESPVTYIPMDRRLAIASGEDLPDRVSGAALFADITGFTSLTETLVRELGPKRGADELNRQLNMIYEGLITEVHRYRGSVIGFSGDAITCWFDKDDSLRATACGLAMQRIMTAFETVRTYGGGTVSLAMKAGLAIGPARRFRVGDPQIQYVDVLSGGTVDRVVMAEQQAKKGELVIDPQSLAHVGDNIEIGEWRSGSGPMQSEASMLFAVVSGLNSEFKTIAWPNFDRGNENGIITDEQVRPWLLKPVFERLSRQQARFMAEIRPVVALFLRFDGPDFDRDDNAGAKLDTYIRWVQNILAHYEGYLIQLTTGDKGNYLYATFGAPIAHEDDPKRAVVAALELRSPPPEIDFVTQTQIGLSRGWMHTGDYGSRLRRTYGVIGYETNVAVRLMSQAGPGQILLTGRVAAPLMKSFQFQALGPIFLKGHSQPIPVYALIGGKRNGTLQKDELEPKTPLVGRQAERSLLTEQLNALRESGTGGILIIQGEAGIGKSRLVAELTSMAVARNLTVLSGAGQSIEQQTPYRAWRDIFSAYFDLSDGIDPAADRLQTLPRHQARVRNLVSLAVPDQIERLPLLNDLLDLELPDTNLTATLDPALRKESLASLLVNLLLAWIRKRPSVVVVEDAHWLDGLSWELLIQVARSSAILENPLLLVVVTRQPDENHVAGRHISMLHNSTHSKTIALTALTSGETVALVTATLRLLPNGLPGPIADLVGQRAGGNPFFAEEIIFTLRDQGIIRIEPVDHEIDYSEKLRVPNRCLVCGDLNREALSDTIQGLILARIDRLPLAQQLTLKVAAIIGRTFDYTLLRDILTCNTAISEDSLKAHLDTLVESDLTSMQTPPPRLTYSFKHIITQEVAYQTLTFAQRRQLHQAVAEWYERAYKQTGDNYNRRINDVSASVGQALSSILPLLVYHFRQSECQEQERHYARLAGEQAAAQFANDEAEGYFSRALDLTPEADYPGRYSLLMARERIYQIQGNRQAQTQDLIFSEELAEAMNDDSKRAEVALRRANLAEAISDYPATISSARAAIDLAHAAGDAHKEAEGHLIWGQALWRQGEYQAAQTQLEWAQGLVTAQPRFTARALRTVGLIAWHQGDFNKAKSYFEQALRISRQISDQQHEGLVLNNLGLTAVRQGDYAATKRYFEQSLLLCRQVGHRQLESTVLSNLGLVFNRHCDNDTARAYLEQSLVIKREIGDRQGEGVVLDNLGYVAMHMGNYTAAKERLDQSLLLRREVGDRDGEGNVLYNLGNVFRHLGDYQRAEDYFRQSLLLRQAIGDRQGEGEVLAFLSLLYHHLDDNETAYGYGQQAWSIAQELGDHHLQGYALTHIGHAQTGLEQFAKASTSFRKAVAVRRELGETNRAMESLAGLLNLLLLQDNASCHVEAEQILEHLEQTNLEGTEEPLWIYLVCYQVLRSAQDRRAEAILNQAFDLLQKQAATLDDGRLIETFLENVVVHREIVRLWQENNREK